MEEKVYILHGHWETEEERGVDIVCASFEESIASGHLAEIAAEKAQSFCSLCMEKLETEQSDTMYEMRDMQNGGFAGFYVTEQKIQIDDSLIARFRRENEKDRYINRARLCYIISETEMKQILHTDEIVFCGGILAVTVDWWRLLEERIGKPIISVRESGRESWKEYIVIATEGYIDRESGIHHLFGTKEYIKEILAEIFQEAENDEYEVYENYAFDDLSEEDVQELNQWVHDCW